MRRIRPSCFQALTFLGSFNLGTEFFLDESISPRADQVLDHAALE